MEKLQSPRPVVITGVAQTFWRSLLVFPTTTQGLEWEAKLDRPRPQRRDLAPSPEVSETATHRSPPLRRPRLLSAKPPPLSEAPPTPPAELLQLPGFRSCGRRTASYPGPDSGPSGQAHWTWSSDQLSLIFWDQLRAFLIPSSGDSSLQTAECRDSMKARPLTRELCHSCAVVSSSGQMLGSGLGAQIDGAECVLRMNQAPTVGFEEDVGQRSTLRVISHTSVPLLLRNYSHYFQHARDTLYVVWGQGRHMDRMLGGRTYRTLLQLTRMYPGLQVYTFTERMMAYCDQIFQDETGKNRRQSGSFLSTGWFTMILALELCEEIVVYGMVSDSYCSEKSPRSVPYHYFEKGRLDECQMYRLHEQAPRSAHRFITEKAVFSRWAKKRPIVFAHPSWKAK
nr:alpha-N-acetyl-neuraminyl-2,3-beta-galactosyl-1,3-N-acetyl-galactosaminide alpha-2,6-sialyltransferase isoform X4 [Rattus norvegicus]